MTKEKSSSAAATENGGGLANPAFHADSSRTDIAIELKEPHSPTKPPPPAYPREEPEDSDDEDDAFSNPCSPYIEKVQNSLKTFYRTHENPVKYSALSLLLAGFLAFLIYGLVQYPDRTYPLAIIAGCVFLFALYYKVLKPKFGEDVDKAICRPIGLLFRKFWETKFVPLVATCCVFLAFLIFIIVDAHKEPRRLVSAAGLLIFILLLFLTSTNPARVRWRPVAWGLGLQFIFGLIILRWSVGITVFNWLSDQVNSFLGFTFAGTSFVYGFLVAPPNICGMENAVLAFSAFQTVIFFSSFISVLYYFGVMQYLVKKTAGIMQVTMKTTAAESMSSAGNIFVGQTEAPLLIKPYLAKMTKSEVAAVMTGGFSTIAGTVFGIYVSFGACANHLLSASVMSAPAALAVAKLTYPETEKSKTKKMTDLDIKLSEEKNAIEAAANGATSGVFLVANIIANLIAFLAFLEFFNSVTGWLGGMVGYPELTLDRLLSYIFYPFAYIMGTGSDHEELLIVAELMGVKTFLNEFIAYKRLKDYLQAGRLSKRAHLIATYSLCGFSNFASIGVQLGGLGVLAPEKRPLLAQLALRCMIAGTFACYMTACVAGILTTDVGDCVGLNLLSGGNTCINVTAIANATGQL